MPRIAAPTTDQDVKRVGQPVDLRAWLDEYEPIKNTKGNEVGKKYLNISKDAHDDLAKGKVQEDDDGRLRSLTSKNLVVTIDVARRNLGNGDRKTMHEMEFVVVRPLTIKGALMLVNDQGDALFDGLEELPSVCKFFTLAWVNNLRNNANARMTTQVEGIERKKDQGIKALMAIRGWSYERAAKAFNIMSGDEEP